MLATTYPTIAVQPAMRIARKNDVDHEEGAEQLSAIQLTEQ